MRAYTGLTRDKALRTRLEAAGIFPLVVRGELGTIRGGERFAYDNGAFRDFTAGAPFDAVRFLRDLWRMRDRGLRPDFLVAPDLVAGGLASLEVSLSWLPDCLEVGAPVYLAVQDGMDLASVREALAQGFGGIFVGGSLEWKLATAKQWAALAHELGMVCHVGRVGSAQRVRWADECGVDSVDSCVPLWSTENLSAWLGGLREVGASVAGAQLSLF